MRYTTTYILAAVVILTAALIYVYRDSLTGQAPPPAKPAEAAALLEKVRAEEITGATISERSAAGEMKAKAAFKKIEGQWRMTEPLDGPADSFMVDRLVQAAVGGLYRQSVDIAPKGKLTLEAAGLAPAAYQLALSTAAKGVEAGKTITVSIGKRTALGEGLYVRVDDSPKVMIMEKADLLDRARDKLSSYRSHELLGLGRGEVSRIDLDGEKGKARLDRSAAMPGRWVLADPASRANPEATAAVVRAVESLSVKDFVDDDPKDLGHYGLDKPKLTVTVWKPAPEKPKEPAAPEGKAEEKPAPVSAPIKAATVRFGGWADIKHDTVYAMADSGKAVVSVEASIMRDLDKGPRDLRDKRVLVLDPARAKSISVKNMPISVENLLGKVGSPEAASAAATILTSFDLAKAEGGWKIVVPGRPDAKADPAAVEAFLKDLSELKVLYFAEGEFADLAKNFKPQGSVRVTVEGESAPVGLETSGGEGGAAVLVKNLAEEWIGRANDRDVAFLKKDWLGFLDRRVLTLDPKQVIGLSIQTPDRKVVLEKKGDQWQLTAPVAAEPEPDFIENAVKSVQSLVCEKFVAATRDFKAYGLDPAPVVAKIRLSGVKAGEPAEKTLRLAREERGKCVGRLDDSDPVFEVSPAVFALLTSEPVNRRLTDVLEQDINRLEVIGGGTTIAMVKVDNKWFRALASGMPGEEAAIEPVRELLMTVADLAASRWVSYDAKDPAAYGLDKPALQIKMTTDRATTTILVSDKEVAADVAGLLDQRPIRYAMVDGGQKIAVLAGRQAEVLTTAPQTLAPQKEETKPAEAKPAEARPAEAKPAEATPIEIIPSAPKP
jgi:hypothetical protein